MIHYKFTIIHFFCCRPAEAVVDAFEWPLCTAFWTEENKNKLLLTQPYGTVLNIKFVVMDFLFLDLKLPTAVFVSDF